MKRKYNFFITILVLVLTIFFCQGCLKENDLRWKLPRDNEGDARQNILNKGCKLYNCESSEDFVYDNSGPNRWSIEEWGYKGSCFSNFFISGTPSIILNPKNQTPIALKFWANIDRGWASSEGSEIKVFVNNKNIGVSRIRNNTERGWMKFQTQVIYDLNCSIKFFFDNPKNLDERSNYLDEIEILCE
jgi:hypothetical protein